MAFPNRTYSALLVFLVTIMLLAVSAWGGCPTPGKVSDAALRTFQRKIEVVGIRPSSAPGICEIHVRLSGQNRIIYTDAKGDFLLAGQLYEASSGRNLTKDAIGEINRLSAEEMKALEPLTAFTLGEKGEVVYFVTDPQCPYCKKAEAVLKALAEAGELQVRFLLFPLRFHQGAKEQCISVICDNKGVDGLDTGYRSDNQCPEGVKKVAETILLLEKKSITGTPTYIFSSGRYHSGVLNEEALLEQMGMVKAKEAQSKE